MNGSTLFIIVLNKFDYDSTGKSIRLFQQNYLQSDQLSGAPQMLRHLSTGLVNTSVSTGRDLDQDGKIGGPRDGFGFGDFPGQYGVVVLSRFLILKDEVCRFRHLIWKDMPDVWGQSDRDIGKSWYTDNNLCSATVLQEPLGRPDHGEDHSDSYTGFSSHISGL